MFISESEAHYEKACENPGKNYISSTDCTDYPGDSFVKGSNTCFLLYHRTGTAYKRYSGTAVYIPSGLARSRTLRRNRCPDAYRTVRSRMAHCKHGKHKGRNDKFYAFITGQKRRFKSEKCNNRSDMAGKKKLNNVPERHSTGCFERAAFLLPENGNRHHFIIQEDNL